MSAPSPGAGRWPDDRLQSLFGIEHPIVQGGMVYNSGAKLAAAVSNAGGLGLIGAGSMRPDLFREQIRKARALTDRPFGVNLPLLFPHVQECFEIALEEGVKIYFTSAGSPKADPARMSAFAASATSLVRTLVSSPPGQAAHTPAMKDPSSWPRRSSRKVATVSPRSRKLRLPVTR